MDEDVSRKGIFVLVIVAVVISLLSTTLVMNTVYTMNMNSITPSSSVVESNPTAQVTLAVPSHAQPASVSTTGEVVLEVPNH